MNRSLSLHTPHGPLFGELESPEGADSLLVFVACQRTAVDAKLAAHFATLGHAVFSMDLLSYQEYQFPDSSQNIPRLTQRLLEILDFIRKEDNLAEMPVIIYGVGDAAPAILRVAAQRDALVKVVVLQGGWVDRAGRQALEYLAAPLLILLTTSDHAAIHSEQMAHRYLSVENQLHFLKSGENPADLAEAWFRKHL